MSIERTPKRNPLSNGKRFLIFFFAGLAALLAVMVLFLTFGAESEVGFSTVWEAIFHHDPDNFSHTIVTDIRLPRLLADLMVGICLSVAGAIMQGTTKNPMADTGIMGISAGSTLGVVAVMAFFPEAGRYERMGFSALGAALVTFLIYGIAYFGRKHASADRMVLSGMAISTFLSSFTTAIVLKYGLMNQMIKYTSGSSQNVIWNDIAISSPFFGGAFLLALFLSPSLTVMNLGEDVSKGLGANTKVTKILSTIAVLILSAVSVVVIGPVAYVGLMIPYIARYMVGTDYRLILPTCAVYGPLLVGTVDLIARVINPGMEFPVGLLITVIGVPFFIYTSRRMKGDAFRD